jgi:hypothetical protein
MSLDVIFATVVGVLAGLAVIGALVFVLVCRDHEALTAQERRP